MSRIPGPLGSNPHSGIIVPVLDTVRRLVQSLYPDHVPHPPRGTPHSPGPTGTNDQAATTVCKAVATAPNAATETKEAKDELDLLRRLYGMMKNRSNKKRYFSYDAKKNEWSYDTELYIRDRSDYFGSTKAYLNYKAAAKKELDADKAKLRRYIEPQPKKRKKHEDWKDGQDVFYSWVKKAYEKKHGTKSDYAKIIKAQMSEKLKKALAQARADYGKSFRAGGFNPRPVKRPGGAYLLGTLSEHAVGNAIDIDSSKNPQITAANWRRILAFTGKTVSLSALATKWKSKNQAGAKEVYDTIKGVSDEWASRIDKAVAKLQKDADAAAKTTAEKKVAPKKKPAADYLDRVIAADQNLKGIGKAWVKKYQDGFLAMEWALVKELHEEGFRWGATFRTPDLHHFEL